MRHFTLIIRYCDNVYLISLTLMIRYIATTFIATFIATTFISFRRRSLLITRSRLNPNPCGRPRRRQVSLQSNVDLFRIRRSVHKVTSICGGRSVHKVTSFCGGRSVHKVTSICGGRSVHKVTLIFSRCGKTALTLSIFLISAKKRKQY